MASARYVVRIETDALWKARWVADVVGWATSETVVERTTIHSARPARDRRRGQTESMRWLGERLVPGASVSASRVLEDGAKAGFSEHQLRRAKRRLGVEVVRRGYGSDGRWSWRLPAGFSPDVFDGPPRAKLLD